MKSKAPLSWIFFLIAVAAVVAAIILTSPRGPLKAPSTQEEVEEEGTPREETFNGMMRAGPNAIYVDTQTAGSSEVVVGLAVMERPGFVVIHADELGVPGVIVGISPLQTENSGSLRVTMNEPLVEGSVYYAMIYADNGDGGFSFVTDTPVTDLGGNVILMTFEAQAGYVPEEGALLL